MNLTDLQAIIDIDGDVVLAGVRHHSPACARAVQQLLRSRRWTQVLIEGPDDVTDLSGLQDPQLRAPVALFTHVAYPKRGGMLTERQRHAGWYPFCDYSPELVAIRESAALNIPVAFCDLGLHARLCVERSLAARLKEAERDLFAHPITHNAFHKRLMQTISARDEDDLWDQLFELSARPHDVLLRDVAAYGLALREASTAQQRKNAGDTAREAHMAHVISQSLHQKKGPILVVCGAFHLAGIRDALQQGTPPPKIPALPRKAHHGVHLIPYDFQRMRRLRYAAGMPQPGWYQASWDAPDHRQAWLTSLTDAARHLRAGSTHLISTADVQAAAEQAQRLATFRDHPSPSRVDVFDAALSCWSKGTDAGSSQRMRHQLETAFCGQRSGHVGDQSGDPPLVRDVDAQLQALSLHLPSGRSREVRLRPVRAARDRQRSQVLTRLQHLGVDYAQLLRGPNLRTGENLDRVEQVWALHWSPENRAALFACAAYGATLADAAAERLREQIATDPPRSVHAVQHLIAACALGLHDFLPPLLTAIMDRLDTDSMLSSTLQAMHSLVSLYRHRDALDAIALTSLEPLLRRCGERAIWLLSTLPDTAPDRSPETVLGLVALDHAATTLGDDLLDRSAMLEALEHVRPRLVRVAAITGAADAVLWRAGVRQADQLRRAILQQFTDPDPEAAGAYLGGLMAVARRAYQEHDVLITAAGDGLSRLEEMDFRRALPRLRREHTALNPGETARLARHIWSYWGGPQPGALDVNLPIHAEQLHHLQAAVQHCQQQLSTWGLHISSDDATLTSGDVPPPSPVWIRHDPQLLRRWRLVLGRYADALPSPTQGADHEMDQTLGYLYDREYSADGREQRDRTGGRDDTKLTVPDWINHLEALFPRETHERLEAEALERYGLKELVTDEDVLARCEPSMALLEAILRLKHHMRPSVLDAARRIVHEVATQLYTLLLEELRQTLSGSQRLGRLQPRGVARSFHPRETLRRNLQHFDPQRRQIIVSTPWFQTNIRRHANQHIIVCVDQSGSMLSSAIHAGIVAAVCCALPGVRTNLFVFDTHVVDLSERCDDPVETLLSVQLGGGTNIAQALQHCATQIEHPKNTIVVLISDLYEGGHAGPLIRCAQGIVEGGSRLLVLAALNEEGQPDFDRVTGQQLAECGAIVGAMSPRELVRWLGEVLK